MTAKQLEVVELMGKIANDMGKLSDLWDTLQRDNAADVTLDDSLTQHYPEGWKSYDEVSTDAYTWFLDVKDALAAKK